MWQSLSIAGLGLTLLSLNAAAQPGYGSNGYDYGSPPPAPYYGAGVHPYAYPYAPSYPPYPTYYGPGYYGPALSLGFNFGGYGRYGSYGGHGGHGGGHGGGNH